MSAAEAIGARPRTAPPARVTTPELAALEAGAMPHEVAATWPVIGAERPGSERVGNDTGTGTVPGSDTVPVTFAVWAPAGHEVLLHLNGITDGSREDVEWALLPTLGRKDLADPSAAREAAGVPAPNELHAAAFLLPRALICGYRYAILPHLPRDAGHSHSGWKAVHEAGVPDPLAAERMSTPLGGDASVLTLPGAVVHAAWDPDTPPRRRPPYISTFDPGTSERPAPGEGVRLWDFGRHDAAVILFDAEQWEAIDLVGALRRLGTTPPLMIVVDSGDSAQRSAFLPFPARVQARVGPALRRLCARHPGLTRERILATGQSYGGLAAVGLVAGGNRIAGRALAQSASLHARIGPDGAARVSRPGPGDATVRGSLIEAIELMETDGARADGDDPRPGRGATGVIDLISGTEEPGMLDIARTGARILAAAGHEVGLRAAVGGHDYAWWRHELLRGLEAFG